MSDRCPSNEKQTWGTRLSFYPEHHECIPRSTWHNKMSGMLGTAVFFKMDEEPQPYCIEFRERVSVSEKKEQVFKWAESMGIKIAKPLDPTSPLKPFLLLDEVQHYNCLLTSRTAMILKDTPDLRSLCLKGDDAWDDLRTHPKEQAPNGCVTSFRAKFFDGLEKKVDLSKVWT